MNGLHQVATAAGLAEVVAPLVAECSRPTRPIARIVVAGATKRGKSALVNALVGRPGLVPVDTDVATGVHIALRHADADRAVVHLADTPPREVPPTDVERYASERHNPGNGLDVLAVELELPAPLLARGVELVDTPGVDSIVARHADVTLAALGLADALVLVVDPSRPLIAPELAFLREATQRIGQVVFVLTKIDTHPEWRRVLEDDRALVATHAARFAQAPFLAVSGRLKSVADDARLRGRDALAERVVAEAGTEALEDELARIAEDLDVVRLGNVVQMALVVVARLAAAVHAARPTDDPSVAAALEADQERLRRLQDSGTRWRQELAHGFRRLQFDVDAALTSGASRADEALLDSLNRWSPERSETLPRELDDVVRALWLEAATVVRERVEVLVAELVTTVSEQGVELARPELALPETTREGTRRPEPEDDPTARGVAGALGSYGAAAGLAFGAERLLMPLGLLLGIGGLGLGAAIGLAGIALRRRTMNRVREQRAAQRLTTRTISESRQQMQREFAKHLVEVQFGLEATVTDLLAQRRRELGDAVADAQATVKRTAEERRTRRRELDEHLAALERLRTDAAALHQVATSAQRARRTPAS
ncbi:dynamin family protein [Actinomycetospora sp. CA-101289]|uniref:dynamin family protein n=1 Tax=Actinomycetospora sp. CA-101289 TaxID=3239893 RepID=UPI003D951D36